MLLDELFFLLPSKSKFVQGFGDKLKDRAGVVWQQLDGLSLILLIVTAVVGIGSAICYYTWYNEMPGRHYKIKHWAFWAAFAFFLTLGVIAVIEYVGINTAGIKKTDLTSLYWLCALNNAFYCIILYFLTSLAWCNFFRTNAYKFLKF